ncbi:unnamed protein product [Rhizophagus irregularis]|nr:unnamed protein product [Rhizophagus irregularis]
MIIYKDVFHPEEEFCSDAYPMKLIDDVVFEVDCQLVTVKKGVDIDIGANPSAEEAEEALEEGSEQVNNPKSKKVLGNFNDYQFYTGKNFEQEGMIALLNYREDGITPYFTLFKDGLIEEKVVCINISFFF